MADQTAQTQQQPDYSGMARVVGPDKKMYYFPKGTTKQQAIEYFKRKGIGAKAPEQVQSKEGVFQKLSRQTAEESQRQWNQVTGPEAAKNNVLQRTGHAMLGTLGSAESVASDMAGGILNAKNAAIAATGFLHPAIPLGVFLKQSLTGVSQSFAELHKNPSPDNVQKYIENLASIPLILTGAKEQPHALKPEDMNVSETLRDHAAKLDNKVLKTAEPGAKGYKLNVALEVANQRIIGTVKSLPDKIEAIRQNYNQRVKAAVAAADQSGKTVDLRPGLGQIINDTMNLLNTKGVLDDRTIRETRQIIDQLRYKRGPQGQLVPRNLGAMRPSEALALTEHDGLLSDKAEFNKERPDAVNKLVRRMREQVNNNVGRELPEIQKMRQHESSLITARDAARETYAKMLNDKLSTTRGIIYGSAGAMGVYLALRALGTFPVMAIGSVVIMRALAESTPSRTARAALYAKIADVLDSTKGTASAPSSPYGASAAMTTATGPLGPQPPVTQGFTGQTGPGGAGPSEPPFAPSEVVSRNPPPIRPTRGTELPEHASRARAGSGDYVRGEEPKAAKAAPSVAESNTKTAAPKSDVKAARAKILQQAMDRLLARQPKNAMDAATINKQIQDIKYALRHDATPEEISKQVKRVKDSERLAGKREEAASKATPTEMSGGEPVAGGANPEQRALLLEAGYKKLESYPGGKEMAKKMRDYAKSMHKAGAPYDEMTGLAEAIKAMEAVKNMPED